MAQTVCILLGDEDRLRLAAIAGDRNRPQKHVHRARIVLLSRARLPVLSAARPTALSPARGRPEWNTETHAPDRTKRGLPMKPGKCGTMTNDYKRNGTTTLFAALNILDGTVGGRCMPSHTHKEFIKFLNAVERAVPAGKIIHAILDNYGTHKHPKVRQWLVNHPRWVFHFTPTS